MHLVASVFDRRQDLLGRGAVAHVFSEGEHVVAADRHHHQGSLGDGVLAGEALHDLLVGRQQQVVGAGAIGRAILDDHVVSEARFDLDLDDGPIQLGDGGWRGAGGD